PPRALRGLDVDRRARARRRREARPPAREALHLGRAARGRGDRRGGRRLGSMSSTQQTQQLWGGETEKAVANFPVSGEPIPAPIARWLGRIKGAAARVNADLGRLGPDKAVSFPPAAVRSTLSRSSRPRSAFTRAARR